MFGRNNDAYNGRGFGQGNGGQGRGRHGQGRGRGFGQGSGRGSGRGQGRGQNQSGNGFGGHGHGFGCGRGQGNGFGQGCEPERFDDFGQGRMGRGPCGMGRNRFQPGRGGAFRESMGYETASFGPNAGFCPLCSQHCPLSAPSCPKGEAYAARMR